MGASKPNRGLGLGSSRPSGSYGGICGSARWCRAAFVMSMPNSPRSPLCTASWSLGRFCVGICAAYPGLLELGNMRVYATFV